MNWEVGAGRLRVLASLGYVERYSTGCHVLRMVVLQT